MTKKHYEAIADIIADKVKNPSHNKITLYVVATEMSHYFAQDNPKFNRARFLQACGVECNGRHDTVNDIVKCHDCAQSLDNM